MKDTRSEARGGLVPAAPRVVSVASAVGLALRLVGAPGHEDSFEVAEVLHQVAVALARLPSLGKGLGFGACLALAADLATARGRVFVSPTGGYSRERGAGVLEDEVEDVLRRDGVQGLRAALDLVVHVQEGYLEAHRRGLSHSCGA